VVEPLLERRGLAARDVLVVVGQEQAALAAHVLGEDVELDHVHAGRERRVEALARVAGSDEVRPLVPDAPQWPPGGLALAQR
jgi:hypothetical protein